MKNAFTMIEILIMVAILGILSALTVPLVQDHILKAKESNAASNIRELRNAIELFAIKNGTNPGYNSSGTPTKPLLLKILSKADIYLKCPKIPSMILLLFKL